MRRKDCYEEVLAVDPSDADLVDRECRDRIVVWTRIVVEDRADGTRGTHCPLRPLASDG